MEPDVPNLNLLPTFNKTLQSGSKLIANPNTQQPHSQSFPVSPEGATTLLLFDSKVARRPPQRDFRLNAGSKLLSILTLTSKYVLPISIWVSFNASIGFSDSFHPGEPNGCVKSQSPFNVYRFTYADSRYRFDLTTSAKEHLYSGFKELRLTELSYAWGAFAKLNSLDFYVSSSLISHWPGQQLRHGSRTARACSNCALSRAIHAR